MWYTRFVPPAPQLVGYNYEFGFRLKGDNITFQDFAIFGSWRNRAAKYNTDEAAAGNWPWDSDDGFGRAFDRYMYNNASFKRLWIERMIVGGWVEGGNNLLWQDTPYSSIRFQGIRLKDVDIIDPVYYGVLVQTTQGQKIEDTEFDGIHITMDKSGDWGLVANDSHKAPPSPLTGKIATTGAITLKNSTITGQRANSSNLFSKDDVSSGTFSFKDGGGNSWTGDR